MHGGFLLLPDGRFVRNNRDVVKNLTLQVLSASGTVLVARYIPLQAPHSLLLTVLAVGLKGRLDRICFKEVNSVQCAVKRQALLLPLRLWCRRE